MKRRIGCWMVAGLMMGLALPIGIASAATPEQVEIAIQRAKNYLYAEQNKKGPQWEEAPARKTLASGSAIDGSQWGGRTAAAVYALLASGESPQDPRLAPAIEWLMNADIQGVYALGLRAQIWQYLPPSPKVKQAIKRDAELLIQGVGKTGKNLGFYHYHIGPTGHFHHSTAQYGVLGMWGCERAGLEVPQGFWKTIDTAWRGTQASDGGWSYNLVSTPERGATTSMTAAGLATLFITQDYLYAMRGVNCRGNIEDEAIEKGMAWISEKLKKDETPYTWYGIERIGVASGYKYFGTINWYEQGADWFVRRQQVTGDTGRWVDHGVATAGTGFGLIFLSRGRAPVVMNKLDYSYVPPDAEEAVPAGGDARRRGGGHNQRAPLNWNQRPRDANNIVNWIGQQIERDLNWQIVNLHAPTEELHDAPILYIAGDQALSFKPEEIDKLRQYVEEGGMIIGNADCGSRNFASSFIELGKQLFPSYEFRDLPDDHSIHTMQQFTQQSKRKMVNVKGLSNGTREMLLLFPQADPSRAWQTKQSGGKEELFQVLANIFLYAVDKQNLRNKGETYLVKDDPKIKADRTIKVARLAYTGNWNPEPAGWRRLTTIMKNDNKVALTVNDVKLGEGKLTDAKVAHLTGTTKFNLDDKQREELKAFITGGGTLVIDAAGGSSEFIQSVEQQLSILFPIEFKQLEQALPQDHPIYTIPGNAIQDIGYRAYARQNLIGNARMGRVRGLTIDNRLAVVYSREDLTTGLVGQPVDGILGYDPKTASKLMANILLYSAYGKDGGAPPPKDAAPPKDDGAPKT